MDEQKVPFWRDDRVLKIVGQVLAVLVIVAIFAVLANNFLINFKRSGLNFGFSFLNNAASFGIGDTPIPYVSTDSFGRALLVGLVNSLRVMVLGIILAMTLGIVVGVARLSDNWLVRNVAMVYVETLRNTPLLLQLFCWYFALFLQFPKIENPIQLPGPIYLSQTFGMSLPWPVGNAQTYLALAFLLASAVVAVMLWRWRIAAIVQRGESGRNFQMALIGVAIAALLALIFGLDWEQPLLENNSISGGLNLLPEFGAILFGLVFYTAAFIAEVVRAGIQSVSKGQWEASRALGLSSGTLMQLVVFPQALRVMIPPLTSEFVNLAKNSSLATGIGYPDVFAIANTITNQSGRAVEMILVLMVTYLTINLLISLGMNIFNNRVQLKER
jgi:general L-amino acid transport system permease protein